MGPDQGGKLTRDGMYAYPWLSHVVQQKLSQHWEAIIFQKKKKKRNPCCLRAMGMRHSDTR